MKDINATRDKPADKPSGSARSNLPLILVIIFISLILPLAVVISGSKELKTSLTDSILKIKGVYGLTIKYSDIKLLDTLTVLPEIKTRTHGYVMGRIVKGNFTLSDMSKARLFITLNRPPYLFIKTEDLDLYLNFHDKDKTLDLYNELAARLNKIRY